MHRATGILVLVLTGCGAFPQPARNADASTDSGTIDGVDPNMLTITSTSPANGSTGNQATTTTITATFSAPLDCSSVTSSSLSVDDLGTAVVGQVTCDQSTLTFVPSSAVPTNAMLEVTINAGVRSVVGTTLALGYTWSFGTAPWTRQFGTPGIDAVTAVVVDVAGNVYVVGSTVGALDGGTNLGLNDAFVTKYGVNGVRQWTRQFGTIANDYATGIARDPSGNVVISGYTSGDFDGPNAGGTDVFIAKYDANGTATYKDQFGTIADDFGHGVAVDPNGNIFVAGTTRGDLDGTSPGGYDLFVAKYDGGGRAWIRQLGTTVDEFGSEPATDPSGNVYVTGYTFGGLDGNTNVGMSDMVLVKYNASGVKQWTRQLGSASFDSGNAVAIDASGYIYVVGEASADFDGNTSAGGQDVVLAKYTDTGVKHFTRQLGTTTNDVGYGITTDPSGNVYVTGNSSGGLDGNTSAGGQDVVVVKYALNGVKQWTRQVGTAVADGGTGIAVSGAELVVVGGTAGALDGNTSSGGYDGVIVKYQQDGRKR